MGNEIKGGIIKPEVKEDRNPKGVWFYLVGSHYPGRPLESEITGFAAARKSRSGEAGP